MCDAENALRRMHQASEPQQGGAPISASAGQLYGTDGNPVILKVSSCCLPCCSFIHFDNLTRQRNSADVQESAYKPV